MILTKEDYLSRFIPTGAGDKDACDYLNQTLDYAIHNGVSDIHIGVGKTKEQCRVSFRVNGEVIETKHITPELAKTIKTKICSKANINDAVENVPHDGRMTFTSGRVADVRVNILPLRYGSNSITCRILDSANSAVDIDSYRIDALKKYVLKNAVKQSEGMILVSGPTGSGKTTTLYSLLNYVYTGKNKIHTIENPVEYINHNFYQSEVTHNMSFSMALTAILRQDPDVIMVGEIRDKASAETAIKASETGHILLSTVHANDSISTITRLTREGVSMDQISDTLRAVVAQRLIRSIPPDVKFDWVSPTPIEKKFLIKHGIYFDGMRFPSLPDELLTDRLPIMEIIEINQELRDALIEGGGAITNNILSIVSKQQQFETLTQSGVRLALQGKTTLDSVRQTMSDSKPIPLTKRFEQLLVESGSLDIFNLEKALEIYVENQINGSDLSLSKILLDNQFVTQDAMAAAISQCNYSAAHKKSLVREVIN